MFCQYLSKERDNFCLRKKWVLNVREIVKVLNRDCKCWVWSIPSGVRKIVRSDYRVVKLGEANSAHFACMEVNHWQEEVHCQKSRWRSMNNGSHQMKQQTFAVDFGGPNKFSLLCIHEERLFIFSQKPFIFQSWESRIHSVDSEQFRHFFWRVGDFCRFQVFWGFFGLCQFCRFCFVDFEWTIWYCQFCTTHFVSSILNRWFCITNFFSSNCIVVFMITSFLWYRRFYDIVDFISSIFYRRIYIVDFLSSTLYRRFYIVDFIHIIDFASPILYRWFCLFC